MNIPVLLLSCAVLFNAKSSKSCFVKCERKLCLCILKLVPANDPGAFLIDGPDDARRRAWILHTRGSTPSLELRVGTLNCRD